MATVPPIRRRSTPAGCRCCSSSAVAHSDYHKPSDTADKINAAGGARVAALVTDLALATVARPTTLAYHAVPAPAPSGDVRSFGASLGTVPDYVGTEEGKNGVLLAGVRPGGPADKAGMRRGDLLIELSGHAIRTIYDFMYVLRAAKPEQSATAVVEREANASIAGRLRHRAASAVARPVAPSPAARCTLSAIDGSPSATLRRPSVSRHLGRRRR
jgi:hypothetical protein